MSKPSLQHNVDHDFHNCAFCAGGIPALTPYYRVCFTAARAFAIQLVLCAKCILEAHQALETTEVFVEGGKKIP